MAQASALRDDPFFPLGGDAGVIAAVLPTFGPESAEVRCAAARRFGATGCHPGRRCA
jgi:hypothetical protein